MKFIPTQIPDVLLVEPAVFRDTRGFFLETYHLEKFKAGGIALPFVQDNHSRSTRGTLRGLHAQRLRPQGKLVRAIRGEIFDVAVDARPGSATYGQHVAAVLSENNFRQLWVPPGFLHGFCVTSEIAEVEYKCTDLYAPGDEIGVRWDDPALGIAWPLGEPLLSAKDAALPTLAELRRRLDAGA
jgi:dTDP-4-dehydrorhamnose 3,5-epimerase